MSITAETIASYLEQYGWSCERVDDAHFATGFRSQAGDSFPVYVTLGLSWVFFAISPFVQAPKDARCEGGLYRHLLRLSQRMNMAKFGVDSDGDVILAVELPREHLDYGEFADALNALSVYADQVFATVQALASDPTAVSSFTEEQDLDWNG
jgi:hypothetical protein